MPGGLNGADLHGPASRIHRTRRSVHRTTGKTRMICQKKFVPCFMALNLTHHSLSLQRGNKGEFVGYPEAPGRSGSPPLTSGNRRISWYGKNSAASPETDPPILPRSPRQLGKSKCPHWSVPAVQLSGAQRRSLAQFRRLTMWLGMAASPVRRHWRRARSTARIRLGLPVMRWALVPP